MLQWKLITVTVGLAVGAWALPAAAQQTATTTAPTAAVAPAPAPVAAAAAPAAVSTPSGSLKIATWAGAYGEAQKVAVFDPFAKDTGTHIEASAQVGAAGVSGTDWDVADLTAADAAELCDKGLIEAIDPAGLKAAPDGTAAAADFLPGALSKCAVGSLAWSSVILYLGDNKDSKSGRAIAGPKTVKDFFDVTRFPGKRGLPRNPRYVLELALMADGVAPDDVYKQLATPEGIRRALRSLSSIRSQIEWWSDPQQAIDLLKAKTVTMTLAYSGRAFMEIATGTKPLKILWDAQIYDVDVWAVSKATHNKSDALKFVAYASGPDRLADTARQLPYGPMRRSAVGLVGNHAILGTDLKPFLPTQPENFATALRLDGTFWRNNQANLQAMLEDWIDNPPSKAGVGKEPNRTAGSKSPG